MKNKPPNLPPSHPEARQVRLNRLRALSHILDNALPIPGTPYRVGIDPLLGLFPAAGDYLSAGLSAYIIVEAALMGASKATLTRMTFNVVRDTFVGIIPVVGDLFDLAIKANAANMALLEAHLESQTHRRKADWGFLIILLAIIVLAVVMVAALSLWLLTTLLGIITG